MKGLDYQRRDYKKYTRAQYRRDEGYAFKLDYREGALDLDNGYGAKNFTANMYFYVKSNNLSNTDFAVYGGYSHKKVIFNLSPSVTFDGSTGIGVSPETKYIPADNTEVNWSY